MGTQYEGYEYKELKLGQIVNVKGVETIIVGFDEIGNASSNDIAISPINGRLGAFIDAFNELAICEHGIEGSVYATAWIKVEGRPFVWINSGDIEIDVENDYERVLEIEYKEVFDKYAVRISHQNFDVLPRGEFKDDKIGNGVMSLFVFDFYYDDTLYLLGESESEDDYVLILEKDSLQQLIEIVAKINEKYGIRKPKRVEKDGYYYYIDESMSTFKTIDSRHHEDNIRFEGENYFLTKEEAEDKLKKIKEILK